VVVFVLIFVRDREIDNTSETERDTSETMLSLSSFSFPGRQKRVQNSSRKTSRGKGGLVVDPCAGQKSKMSILVQAKLPD